MKKSLKELLPDEEEVMEQVKAIRAQQCDSCRDVGYVICRCRKDRLDSRSCNNCRGAEIVPCTNCPKGQERAARHYAIMVKPEGEYELVEGWTV